MHESTVRRRAQRAGYRVVRSRTRDTSADNHGLYVLVGDSRGNRFPGAQAPTSAFARGEGSDLAGIVAELESIGA